MRHRFHSLCPYFAMFPETFVEKQLALSTFQGTVFDPFCGRGTTVFESLIRGRNGAGCDANPVAACVAGAKCNSPTLSKVLERVTELESESQSFRATADEGELTEFFSLCFAPETYDQIQFLRDKLDWRSDRTDRFIAALSLGSLHGESHRSPNYFSNRMPRTISTKPAYSVRWWREQNCIPPARDVFAILRYMSEYRFKTAPPTLRGDIVLSDARNAAASFAPLVGQITDIITSPPYLNTTNYREDQWLRMWFLGAGTSNKCMRDDGRHYNVKKYEAFLTESWAGVAPLLADHARIVVRIGGRKLPKDSILDILESSLKMGTGRKTRLQGPGFTSQIKNTQANAFRGSKPSPTVEHDFCFFLS